MCFVIALSALDNVPHLAQSILGWYAARTEVWQTGGRSGGSCRFIGSGMTRLGRGSKQQLLLRCPWAKWLPVLTVWLKWEKQECTASICSKVKRVWRVAEWMSARKIENWITCTSHKQKEVKMTSCFKYRNHRSPCSVLTDDSHQPRHPASLLLFQMKRLFHHQHFLLQIPSDEFYWWAGASKQLERKSHNDKDEKRKKERPEIKK